MMNEETLEGINMTKEEIIEMHLDWAWGRDETITQSDVIIACLENGFNYQEISEL